MATYPLIVKNIDGFIDGKSYAGLIEEMKVPDVGFETEDLLAGGMGGTKEISMGAVEKMDAEFTINGVSTDMMRQLGRQDGQLTARGAVSDGTRTVPAIYQMRGLFKKIEQGDLKRKDKGSTKLMANLDYLRVVIDGSEVVEVDIMGNRFVVNGFDHFAADRAALGQ